jgi:hypothetical protein
VPKLPTTVETRGGDLMRGGDPSNYRGVDPISLEASQEWAAQHKAQLTEQLLHSPNTGQAFVRDIERVDPQTALDLNRMIHYQQAPGAAGFGNRLSEWNNFMERLAVKANPNWDAGKYAYLMKFREDYRSGGPEGKILGRAQRLRETLRTLWDAIDRLPPGTILPLNQLRRWIAGDFQGATQYVELAHAMQAFAEDIQAVNTTGVPRQGLTMGMLHMVKPGATAAQLRTGVKADLSGAIGSLDTGLSNWRQAFRESTENPDTFRQDAYSTLWQYWNANEDTGKLAEPLPTLGTQSTQGKYLGGDPLDPLNYR